MGWLRRMAGLLLVAAGPGVSPGALQLAGEVRVAPMQGERVPAVVEARSGHNLLVLVADDLGVDMLGAYAEGASLPPTPHLDALAAGGVLFRNAWSQPVCSPTRATLQTGRAGYRTGIGQVISPGDPGLPPGELTLPEMLRRGTRGTYASAAFGKWHLGPGSLAPNEAGYGHFAGTLGGQLASYTAWAKLVDGVETSSTTYATSETVDDALAWIADQRRPWLCYVAFHAPHAPFHAPPAHLHTRSLPAQAPQATCGVTEGVDPRPFYEAMVEALDTEIGRLLAGLAPAELARTSVVFVGDNGTPNCVTVAPFLPDRAKGYLFEGGVNVPLIVSGAAVGTPGESAALVQTSDLFATLGELAGVDPDTWNGHAEDSISLVPYLVDPTTPSLRATVLAEYFTPIGPPVPLPACPPSTVCQVDLGFDGPGGSELTSCGPPLYGAYGSVPVGARLESAPPGQTVFAVVGGMNVPTFSPAVGATLVPAPPLFLELGTSDAAGAFDLAFALPSGSTAPLFLQAVVVDPLQPGGFGVTNALELAPLWTHMRAIRNARYKLIEFDPCRRAFFDLDSDPWELTDLLQGALSAAELANLQDLEAHLAGLP